MNLVLRREMVLALLVGTYPVLTASAALADGDQLSGARSVVMAAHPDMCNEEGISGLSDASYSVSWPETSYDGTSVDRHGTLYEINCYAGAYNLVVAYVFATGDEDAEGMALVSFASPAFTIEYADGDETDTKLKADPVVTGFQADTLLINPVFDAETLTISTFEKWRGLGDAYSAGLWSLQDGQFVLKHYEIDPIYEANLDGQDGDLSATTFVLYDAER